MAHPRPSAGAVPWGRRALGVGLAVSIQVPLVILLSQLVDALHLAYPFVILPLMLAGTGRRPARPSGPRAIMTAPWPVLSRASSPRSSLALGMRLTGFAQWGLVFGSLSPADAAPPPDYPPAHRLADLATPGHPRLSAALAVLLGLLTLGLAPGVRWATRRHGPVLARLDQRPAPLGVRRPNLAHRRARAGRLRHDRRDALPRPPPPVASRLAARHLRGASAPRRRPRRPAWQRPRRCRRRDATSRPAAC